MASLEWAIAGRFVDYVRSLPDGEISCGDGAVATAGAFRFPADAAAALHFTGSVRLTGHGGLLDVVIAEPWISFVDDSFDVTVLDSDTGERFALATGSLGDGSTMGPPRLTVDGSDVFFARYPEGFELDPLALLP
jgi:hypothetical protein